MNETEWRVFRWVAGNAQYVFWGIWGAGLGAFGMVATKAIDPAGVTPPIYLGVLTVLMGGALGLFTSRSMDRLTDERKLRRKQYQARLRLRGLERALMRMVDLLVQTTDDGKKFISASHVFELSVVRAFVVAGNRVVWRARVEPDFDDLLDTDVDTEIAEKALSVFDTCKVLYSEHSPNGFDVEKAQKEATARITGSGINMLRNSMKALQEADEHFARRYSA